MAMLRWQCEATKAQKGGCAKHPPFSLHHGRYVGVVGRRVPTVVGLKASAPITKPAYAG